MHQYKDNCISNQSIFFSRPLVSMQGTCTYHENVCVCFFFRLLNEILDEFNRVLSTKLLCAEQNAEDNESKLNRLSTELEKLENSREEVFLCIKNSVFVLHNMYYAIIKMI